MSEHSRTVAVVKGHLSKFSGIISKGLPKGKQRLVREMIYGLQAAKDVKLSNITRSLNEPFPLIKTEDRLSRNLDDRDFTEVINHQICRLESKNVLDDMVIAIDPGDIRKKYAAKMEGLCKIHDGREHEIGEGYWLAKAVAADIDYKRVIPLYLEAYSQDAGGFISENDQFFKVIDTISTHVGNKGKTEKTFLIQYLRNRVQASCLKIKPRTLSSRHGVYDHHKSPQAEGVTWCFD